MKTRRLTRRLAAAVKTCLACAFVGAGVAHATVEASRDLPGSALTTDASIEVTLAVTVTGDAPNGAIITETLPTNWTISDATWQGGALAPVVIGGSYKWLLHAGGNPVENGDLVYTATIPGGSGSGTYDFTGTVKYIDAGTETTETTTGDASTQLFGPVAVAAVTVPAEATVRVEFSDSMGTGADVAANYTASGAGQGTLAANPDSVAVVADTNNTVYELTWNAPDEMLIGGDITITVDRANVMDSHGLPLGTTDSGTATGAGLGTAPTGTFVYNPATLTNQNVVATLTPSETASVTNNDAALTYTFTANGTFEFQLEDLAGNTGSATAEVTWIDKIHPTATFAYNPATATNQDVVATLQASESVTVTNNDGATTYTFAANGTFEFQFVDAAGNTSTATAEVTWIDKTAPMATFVYNPSALTNQDVVATLQPSEPVNVTNNAGATTYTFTENGTFEFQFVDAVGNTGTATAEVAWIDKTDPTATFAYNPAAATNQDVVATLQPSETVTVTNNGAATTYTFTQNGTFEFQFEDDAGNAGTATAEVTWIDKTVPTMVSFTPPANSLIQANTLNVKATFSELVTAEIADLQLSGTAAASASVDSVADLGNNTWQFALSGLVDGALNVQVDGVQDAVGNDVVTANWSYTVVQPVYHTYDSNHDWVIADAEMTQMKADWAAGTADDFYTLWTLDLWAAGGYRYDSSQVGYKQWQPTGKEYAVIDVSEGSGATSYPVAYHGAAPADLLTNDTYKTTKIVLKKVEGGEFTMGSPVTETGRDDDEVEHQVVLSEDFYMGIYEVTQKQWERVMGTAPSRIAGDAHPVEDVSWYDVGGGNWPEGDQAPGATSFIGVLAAKSGLAVDLPTEARWERACRAGTIRAYSDHTKNGGEGSDCQVIDTSADTNLDPLGFYTANSGGSHHEVGVRQANQWGLYDTHGGVAEWCLDRYGAYAGDETDPAGSVSGSPRVNRGGSWREPAALARSASRYDSNASNVSDALGFRIVAPLVD